MKVNNPKNRVYYFLKATPYMENISENLILKLSKRFSIKQNHLALLIKYTAQNGAIHEN